MAVAPDVPLSVLDLAPITARSSPAAAVPNTIDLAIHAEPIEGPDRRWPSGLGARRLQALRRLTGADELLILTVANRRSDRVGSYELVADAWRRG
ncbi:MAG: hypothetical protein WAL22_18520 [Solirubrobacteraceae bacterium]